MIRISDVTHPTKNEHGKANILIQMNYVLVQNGLGQSKRSDIIDEKTVSAFHAEYKRGNTNLKLLNLPNKDATCAEITKENLSKFPNIKYYVTSVSYNFNIKLDMPAQKPNLFQCMKWLLESQATRGIILCINNEFPFDGVEANSLDDKIFLGRVLHKWLLTEMINENPERFKNQIIFINGEVSVNYLEKMPLDGSINTLMTSLNLKITTSMRDSTLNLFSEWVTYYSLLLRIIEYYKIARIEAFMIPENTKAEEMDHFILAAGHNLAPVPNFVLLNSLIFDNPMFQYESKLSPFETLVHECGHNLASDFRHPVKGKKNVNHYSYDDPGLSSGHHGEVYPTSRNTIGILNDEYNRQNSLIIE